MILHPTTPIALTDKDRVALKRARGLIESGEATFICVAIHTIYSFEQYRFLETKIDRAIWPYGSLRTWLYGQTKKEVSREEGRVARLAWIDWMLAQ